MKRQFNSILQPKPLFEERMKKLLNNEEDYNLFIDYSKKPPVNSIRCNTLKISPSDLKKRLENKEWKIFQPFNKHPEIMVVENNLLPGELGRSLEHLLGYYYIQEISSMLPILVLKPKPDELFLDLASAPGSKTTQAGAMMNNKGTIIANDVNFKRIKILAANLQRCGVMNSIITRENGINLCRKLKKENFIFDKIIVDAPCSGEGTLRSSPKTFLMWNIKTIKAISRLQKALVASAFEILKTDGEMVYSTCTYAPEENEEVVDFLLKNFKNAKIEKLSFPKELKSRQGVISWGEKTFNPQVKNCARICPQDNNTEGFFIAKIKKVK